MSWQAINAAWNVRGLKSSAKCVLVCMANHANEHEGNTTFVSQETIADECGMDTRTVKRIQKMLVEKKHISPAATSGRAAKGDPRTRFAIHPVTGDKLPPVTSDNGNADRGQSRPPQGTNPAATGDKSDTPNITRLESTYPSSNRLDDARGKPVSISAKPQLSVHRLSSAFEKELMARLRTLLGEDEMARAGGNWRANWVRKHPALVQSGLNELDQKIREADRGIAQPISNRGAWLMHWCMTIKTEQEKRAGKPGLNFPH
jgi:Helix-turn-helix domain